MFDLAVSALTSRRGWRLLGRHLLCASGIIASLVGIGFRAASPASETAASQTSLDIEFDRDRRMLRVEVEDAGLTSVLDAIAAQTCMKVILSTRDDGHVTVRFEYLPLEQALARVLENRSFVIANRDGPSSELTLWVLSRAVVARQQNVAGVPRPLAPRGVSALTELPPELAEAIEQIGNIADLEGLSSSLDGQMPSPEVLELIKEALARQGSGVLIVDDPPRLKIPSSSPVQ